MKTTIAAKLRKIIVLIAAVTMISCSWTAAGSVKAAEDDAQPPEITVSMPSEVETDIANRYAGDNRLYYNEEQTISVTVAEADLDLNTGNTYISYTIQEDDTAGKRTIAFSDKSYISDGVIFTVSEDGTAYEAVITIRDGQCLSDFSIAAADLAGNSSANEEYRNNKYIVDNTAPSLDVTVSGDGVVEAGFFSGSDAVYVTFDEPVKEAPGRVVLTAKVTDRNIMFNEENSGYSKENFVKGKLDSQEWSADGTPEINTNKDTTLTYTGTIDVPADTTGTMVFELDVQDLAGNRTDDNKYTSNIRNYCPINEGKAGGTLIADRTLPTFTLTPDPGTPAVTALDPETLLYNSNMNYELDVQDPAAKDSSDTDRYSGLKSVKWEVSADNDAEITTTDGKQSNEIFFEGDQAGTPSATITIPLYISGEERGESDNVHLQISVTDRAGNETTYDQKLAMDDQKPVIESVTANASFYMNSNKLFLYRDKQKKDSFNIDKEGTTDEQNPDDIEVSFVIRELNFNASDYLTALKENERIRNINYSFDGKDGHQFSFESAQYKNEAEQMEIVLPSVTDLAANALVLDTEDDCNGRQNTQNIIGTAEDQSAGEGAVSYDGNVPAISFWYDASPPYSTLDDLRFTVINTRFFYWKDGVRTFYKKGINRFAVEMEDGNGSGIDPGREDGYGNASKAELFFRVDDPTGAAATPAERTDFVLDEKGQGQFELLLAPGMEDDGMKLFITATDNVGNSRTAHFDFNVDTKAPAISGPVVTPDDTPVKTDSKNNKYYDHELKYTFTAQDRNLARTELTYSYLDILTNKVITPDPIVNVSKQGMDPTGTDIVQEVDFTVLNGQNLLCYRVTAWDDAGLEIVDKEYSCNPMHTRSKSEVNIKKVVDLTAPTLTVSQSDRTPDGEHDSEAYYANGVSFDLEVFDLNIDKKDLTYDLETGSGTVITLSRKTNTPGSTDYFTYTGSFTLDDKNTDPANRGDVLTGFRAVIEDYSGHTVERVRGRNNLNLNNNIRGDTITMGRYLEDQTRSIVIDKLEPKIQIKLPNTETLVYDKTVPRIKFDGSAVNEKDGTFYYNSQQNVIVSIVDANLHPEETSLYYKTTEEGISADHYAAFNDSRIIFDRTSAAYTLTVTLKDGEEFSGLKIVKAEDYVKNKKENYAGVSEFSYIIDTTAPRVTVSYDNQSFRNERYHKEDRNLTIRIEDLNFDPTRTTVTTEPGFSGWSQNGNVYTGTVSYSTDGDYKFEMATTDKAGNVATIDYTNGGANTNPQDFTVDKTKPVIKVAFDNNKYLNEKYYKAQRTATITIDEHNFRATDVTTTVRAALDGQSITIPAQSGWSGSTDERVSTIPFKENGDYTINVTYTDLAGNEAEPLVVNEFTVDTVMPEAAITNVKNKSAYKGEILPQIRFYDVNFDPKGYSVLWHLTRLDGTKKLTTEKAGTYSEITHGTVFSFNDLPSTPENDGIYELSATITDLAGNSFETEKVMYSVNRFGSVYDVGEWPEMTRLIGSYTNKAPVIHIRETNPNILTEFSVTASVNGAARELVEGQDFDVIKVEDNGSWKQYIYTIYDSAFMNDDTLVQGEYDLTLYSKDEAGNLNSNRTNNSNLDIAFTIDAETPSGFINVNGLAEGKDNIQAPETAIRVNWEDNIGIERVDIYLNDTLYASLTGEDLAKAAGSYELIVQEKDEEQNVYAVLTDMAGNEIYLDPISFYLNSSGFRQFVRNTPLFVGTICGIAAAAALIIFLIVTKGTFHLSYFQPQRRN